MHKGNGYKALLLAAAAVLLSGCFNSRIHTAYSGCDAQGEFARVTLTRGGLFDYARRPLNPQMRPAPDARRGGYRVRRIAFPSAGENGQEGNRVTGIYYEAAVGGGPKPLVIVLPIWGVQAYPSRTIAEGLVEHAQGRINVLRILGKNYLFDWQRLQDAPTPQAFRGALQDMVTRVRATVVDLRRLLDWAQRRPAVDARRVGIMGFSMGAMVAGTAMEHEPRIAAAALAMGGADPAAILGQCDARAGRVRAAVMRRFGWSREHFTEVARRALTPMNAALGNSLVDPAHVLLFDAYYDKCVPRTARDDLWEALGQPERYSLLYGHRVAFLAMTPLGGNFMRKRIYAFFDRVLLADRDRPRAAPALDCAGEASRVSLAPLETHPGPTAHKGVP